MFGLGLGEIIIICVLGLIVIGPKRLPELARTLGKAVRELNKIKQEIIDQSKQD